MTNRLTIMALAPAQAEGQRRLLEGASQHAAAHRRLCLECDQRLVSRAAEVAVIPAAPPLPLLLPPPSPPPRALPVPLLTGQCGTATRSFGLAPGHQPVPLRNANGAGW